MKALTEQLGYVTKVTGSSFTEGYFHNTKDEAINYAMQMTGRLSDWEIVSIQAEQWTEQVKFIIGENMHFIYKSNIGEALEWDCNEEGYFIESDEFNPRIGHFNSQSFHEWRHFEFDAPDLIEYLNLSNIIKL